MSTSAKRSKSHAKGPAPTKRRAPISRVVVKTPAPTRVKAKSTQLAKRVVARYPGGVHPRETTPRNVLRTLADIASSSGLSHLASTFGMGKIYPVVDFAMALLKALGEESDIAHREGDFKPLPKATDQSQYAVGLCRLLGVEENAVCHLTPFFSLVELTYPVFMAGAREGPVIAWIGVRRFLDKLGEIAAQFGTELHPLIPVASGSTIPGAAPADYSRWVDNHHGSVSGVDPERPDDHDDTKERLKTRIVYNGHTFQNWRTHEDPRNAVSKNAYRLLPAQYNNKQAEEVWTYDHTKDEHFTPGATVRGISAPTNETTVMTLHTPSEQSYMGPLGPTVRVKGRQLICVASLGTLGTAGRILEAQAPGASIFEGGLLPPIPVGGVRGNVIRVAPDFLNLRMAQIGQLYTKWKCNEMIVRYTPSCPTTTAGQMVMGYSSDPTIDFEQIMTGFAPVSQLDNSIVTPFWSGAALPVRCNPQWLFMENTFDSGTALALRQVACGSVLVNSDVGALWPGPGDAPRLGTFWLEYEVEFAGPSPSYGIAATVTLQNALGHLEWQRVLQYLMSNPALLVKLVRETTPADVVPENEVAIVDTLKRLGLYTPPCLSAVQLLADQKP